MKIMYRYQREKKKKESLPSPLYGVVFSAQVTSSTSAPAPEGSIFSINCIFLFLFLISCRPLIMIGQSDIPIGLLSPTSQECELSNRDGVECGT